MSGGIINIFNGSDRLQMTALNHRLKRSEVIHANIANAETPGFRALGYDFEEQLQAVNQDEEALSLKTSSSAHFKQDGVQSGGKVEPHVYMRPTESVGNDGNTVDADKEMALLAQNQILYRAAVETLNKKIGILRYAINGGR